MEEMEIKKNVIVKPESKQQTGDIVVDGRTILK
jgi:hypothetical protein